MSIQQRFTILCASVWFAAQTTTAHASAPHCHPYGTTGYCQYDGTVRLAYVNAYNQLLLYFDAPVDSAGAAAVGLSGVSVTNAAVLNISANPDFAKMMLAAMLSAQARGATVSVQMMAVSNGYLLMDRIWVNE